MPSDQFSHPTTGSGTMTALVRDFDWSTTPLGPRALWPQSLRTTVDLCLASNFPIAIAWGPQYTQIYNDGYRPICGGKHPHSLGQNFRDCWASAWPEIGEAFDRALGGATSFIENQRIFLERNGFVEETFFSFSFSPIRDEAGAVGGLFHPVLEMTVQILSERRSGVLTDLLERTSTAKTVEEACALTVETLARYAPDVPFALLYLIDDAGTSAHLAGCAGLKTGDKAAPFALTVGATVVEGWPLQKTIASGRLQEVTDLQARFGSLAAGTYPESPTAAVLLPIIPPGAERPVGVLVAGVSARLALDAPYRSFLDLLGAAVTTAVANGQAFESERQRGLALATIDRAKTEFLSSISHEFRTPLTLILGPLEESLSDANLSALPEHRARLELAHRNGLRLLKLVNTLLDFAQIEAGRVQGVYDSSDLAALTTDLASTFRSTVEAAGIRLVVDCEPLSEPAFVDREMWDKIVSNLVSNAFKFTLAGTIFVTLRQAGQDAELIVADTGVGIRSHDLARIFERFHQVEDARGRSYEGTGIGLALVAELVKLHGGTVSASSVYGQGSVFTVRLPLGKAHLPRERIGDPARAAPCFRPTGYVEEGRSWLTAAPGDPAGPAVGDDARPWILLADDNADMRSYLCAILGAQGWRVTAVADGDAALASAVASPPDLVLTDIMMPRRDGFGLLTALKTGERTRLIPVIMISARAGEEARVDGMRAGADDYLIKPFAAKELIARINTHLQIGRLRTEAVTQRDLANAVFAEAPVAIVVQEGPEHVFTLANAACFALFGHDRAILGKTLLDAIPELAGQGFEAIFDKVYRTGETFVGREVPVSLTLDDGTTRKLYLDLTYKAKRDLAGTIDGVLTVAIDVTESVMSRALLQDSERRLSGAVLQLQEADRRKDEFLAMLSHELRSPLNVIVGHVDLLRVEAQGTRAFDESLDAIERNTATQVQLVADLLDVSRIITGKMLLQVRSLKISELVKEAIDSVRFAAKAKAVRLEVRIETELGRVAGDATRLQQLFWNLLSNAVKFTPSGGSVIFSARASDARVEFQVEDTGLGISQDFLPYVFDRFHQEDSSKTRLYGGLGLGLAIVRHIAELHGGSVQVASRGKGQGSCFTAWIPVQHPHPLVSDGATLETATPHEPPRQVASPAQMPNRFVANRKLAGVRVLVVDDGLDNQMLMTRLLTASAATVEVASDGEEGIRKATSGAFDAVLMDMQMPIVDGYLATKRLRDGGYCTPIIALTAHSMPGEREKCLAIGCSEYLSKPFKPAQLVEVIERVVQAHVPEQSPARHANAVDPHLAPLVADFVKKLPDRMAALQSAQARSDWPELANLAHQMAGAAGGYGFPSIGRAAAKIESQASGLDPRTLLAGSMAKFTSLCNAAIGPERQLH